MSDPNTASTFSKGLEVLRCFESGRDDLSMSDVARLTGFDRATARRLCLTLERDGFLYRHGKALRLTPKVLALAGGFLSAAQIGKSVQPTLNQFAAELDGEIALAVLEGTRAIYVARSAVATARLSLGFSIGSTLPLLPTAVGRMLLAGCTADVRSDIMARCPIESFTEATDLDPASIQTKIEQAAAQGFAFVTDEFETGAAGVAVPVSRISGALAVLATTTSVNHMARDGQLDHTLDLLRRAAMNLR